jgi:MFS family permease
MHARRLDRSLLTYENGLLLVLGVAFGIVFFDRFAIGVLMPFIARDLGLNNTEVGLVNSALALSWAVACFLGGRLSDASGRRKAYLIVSIIAFSLCSFLSGLATSFAMLLGARLLMGLTEGPAPPLILAIMARASSDTRRGFNFGLIQNGFNSLFGQILAPLILVPIAVAFDWRIAFFVAGVPGLIIALVVLKYVREPARADRAPTRTDTNESLTNIAGAPALGSAAQNRPSLRFIDIVCRRNIWISAVIASLLFGYLTAGTAFMPLYFVEVRGMQAAQMSVLMSLIGFCILTTGVVVPALSDRYGRKPVAVVFSLLGVVSPLACLFFEGPVWALGVLVFIGWMAAPVITLAVAAIPSDSLPAAYHGTAIGLVAGIGEIAGSFVTPTLAGWAADQTSLAAPLFVQVGCAIAASAFALLLRESAPMRVAALAHA